MDQDPNSQNQPVEPPAPTPMDTPAALPTEFDTTNRTPLLQPLPVITPVPDAVAIPSTPPRSLTRMIVRGIIGFVVIGALLSGTYLFGNSQGYTNGKNAQILAQKSAELKVPLNATMVSTCSQGEGTQYVLPSNIPQGPIYNMWNNQVTGIEYMLAENDISAMKTLDLALMNQKYDHVDVMYEPGHAGLSEAHYHLTLSLIGYEDEQKITCDGESDSMQMDTH